MPTRADEKRVREPSAAGRFYPDDSVELEVEVRGLISSVVRSGDIPASMVLAPQAGYAYSGNVAAAAFKQLAPDFERVVILASSHGDVPAFEGVAVETASHFGMPGFEVPVDVRAANTLLGDDLFVDVPAAHQSHVVEVELPFLRAVAERPFRILPLVFGSISRAQVRSIAGTLVGLADGKTAFAFSVDLSHFHSYEMASALDRSCLDALVSMNADEVARCDTDATQVLLVMTELAAMRGLTARFLAYANSGDVSDDKSCVVGYGSVAYEDRFVLGSEEGEALLALARRALEAKVREDEEIDVPEGLLARLPRLKAERGVFVTLKRRGELRGCIGSLRAHRPLVEDVLVNTVNAAAYDSRFEPVQPEELAEIELSISVLDAPRPLEGLRGNSLLNWLRENRPGFVIHLQGRRSTFLPEVWAQVPEPLEFLAELCQKQGASADCWRQPGARFETYGAQYLR